jgi:GLPGLI family protein
MKVKLLFLSLLLFPFAGINAQQFITKAVIEYEVKANFKKTMGGGSFIEMIDNLPQYKTEYCNFTFADNKSIYKFDHWNDESKRIPDWWKKSDEENVWYCDYETGKINMQKNVDGTSLNIVDSIPKLKWRITNENRIIAGFNCRKAVAIMFDSVYVFAFYTDEIVISGGPCSINGLPGMILGVTIPRLFTSWIATKVMVNNVNEKEIKPISAKKNYDLNFLETTIINREKDWYSDDESRNEEIKQQKARFLWQTLL